MGQEPNDDGRSRRARQQREERRQQILDAALGLFARQGYHATAVSDIVQAADVARGTFYLYFASKRTVLDELMDGVVAALEQGIRRVDVSPGAAPPMDQLLANIHWLLTLPQVRPEMLQLLLWEAVGLDEELDRKLESFHRRMFELTERSLATGMALGLVRPCDARVMARCVVGSLKEVLLSLLLRQDLERTDTEALARELLAFSAQGLLRPELRAEALATPLPRSSAGGAAQAE